MSESPIIFALDYPSLNEAREGALRVAPCVGLVKVGLELFVKSGPAAVRLGDEARRPVFLDLKLHDIPETVDRAVAQACELGAKILTIHASGGPAMVRRAVERAGREGTGLLIAAVTVLTSLDTADLASLGIAEGPQGHALRLAKMAYDEGARGFVCSANEVAAMRKGLGPDAVLITPGIRPHDGGASSSDDQKRVATPAVAIAAGANWLVVGRPIRDAADPQAVAKAMTEEALAARKGISS